MARVRGLTVVLALVGLALGLFVGYQMGYWARTGGMAALGAAIFFGMGLVGLGLVGVVAAVAWFIGRPGSRRFATSLVTAGAIAVGGGLAAYVATPALGLDYREAVVLESPGQVTASLDGEAGFVSRNGGSADCRSAGDSQVLDSVTALDLGELGTGTLRGTISLAASGTPSVALWIDGADLPAGAAQPTWGGAFQVLEGGPTDRSGRGQFGPLQLQRDEKTADEAEGWPTQLTGELAWSCEEWRAGDASPAAPVGASMRLELEGVEWVQEHEALAECAFSPDGTVQLVSGPRAGSLQGEPLAVELDLSSALQPDQEALLALALAGKDPPPGQTYKPNWVGRAPVADASDRGRSGRVTFTDLATGVEPEFGPAPAGWPETLTGELSWTCE